MANEFGDWMRRRRETLDLTGEDAARQAVRSFGADTGKAITYGTWSKWERGVLVPSNVSDIDAVARSLQAPLVEALSLLPGITVARSSARMKELCDLEETAHKFADGASDEAWAQFMVDFSRALREAKEHLNGRARHLDRDRGKRKGRG